MKTLIDVLAALGNFVKVASEWAESASKAEVETFTQIYPQKEEVVKKQWKSRSHWKKSAVFWQICPAADKRNGAETAAKARRQPIV